MTANAALLAVPLWRTLWAQLGLARLSAHLAFVARGILDKFIQQSLVR